MLEVVERGSRESSSLDEPVRRSRAGAVIAIVAGLLVIVIAVVIPALTTRSKRPPPSSTTAAAPAAIESAARPSDAAEVAPELPQPAREPRTPEPAARFVSTGVARPAAVAPEHPAMLEPTEAPEPTTMLEPTEAPEPTTISLAPPTDTPTAAAVADHYKAVGQALLQLDRAHGRPATLELWPRFRRIRINAVLPDAAARREISRVLVELQREIAARTAGP